MKPLSRIFCYLSCSLLFSNQVLASGIRINLESVSDLGNTLAGGAALADDASTNYYNPAGITRMMHTQLSFSAVAVWNQAEFDGTVVAPSLTIPGLSTFTASGNPSARNFGVVPALHFVSPITDRLSWGFSFTGPYGLAVNYGNDSILRYTVTDANAESLNFGPSLAYRITDTISIGGGPDVLRMRINIKNKVRTEPLTFGDSLSENIANGYGFGGHIGILYEPTRCTRFGFSYRSQIVANLDDGKSRFTLTPGVIIIPPDPFPIPVPQTTATSDDFTARLVLPPTAILSAYHLINPVWAILGSVDYTGWSVLNNIVTKNVAFLSESGSGVVPEVVTPENLRDAIHVAIATNYWLTEQYMLRAGVGVDQDVSRAKDKNVLIPGLGYVSASLGLRYQHSKALSLDFAYSHAWQRTADINNTSASTGVITSGRSKGYGDVVGMQINWNSI